MSGYYSYDYNDDIDIDSSSDSEEEIVQQPVQPPVQPEPDVELEPELSPPRPKVTLVLPPKESSRSPSPSPRPEYQTTKKKRKALFFSPAYNTGRPKNKGPKIPRPVKLKPLKEVLTKLIAQIKKKDDYAFFLTPVDPAQVPGYTDVIKHPMDFGTMATKVSKGRYRSLEEFADDFNLVVSNAKLFNPPGTIHHTEAARIEAWGLDQIQKASSTVIQYEADWNIEIERDDVARDDSADVPMEDVIPETPVDGRSPSVLSLQGTSRRRPKESTTAAASSKKEFTETLEPGGRMPGAKDGIGVFPPCSDFAQNMLALKLRKKRHITKKERLRIEKAGRPYAADGSFQYTDLDDTFSVLSVFVPDPPSKPRLTPIFPPPSASVVLPPSHIDQPREQPTKPVKHWSISRIAIKKKDAEEPAEQPPSQDTSRDPTALDYGSFAVLIAALEDEMKKREKGVVVEAPKPPKDDGRRKRALESELYLQNVVYGGVVGVSYVRSLAEFLKRPAELGPLKTNPELQLPLPHYIERELIDPQTLKQHLWLRSAGANLQLTTSTSSNAPLSQLLTRSTILAQVRGPIDLGVLMKDTDELVQADSESVIADVLKQTAEALQELGSRDNIELEGEDLRKLRMSLLGLAKRIPIDQIAGGESIVNKS